jgi:hypothetical protein
MIKGLLVLEAQQSLDHSVVPGWTRNVIKGSAVLEAQQSLDHQRRRGAGVVREPG